MPGRKICAATVNRVFIRRLELVPVLPHFEVVFRKLPVLGRILQAGTKPLRLLFLADVQKKFQEDNAVFRELALKRVDLVKMLAPYLLWFKLEHTDNQHLLVVRTVENADVPE